MIEHHYPSSHDHHHHGDHGHSHGHHHPVDPKNVGRTFGIAIVLNIIFVAVECVYGILANSTALVADAGHNLADVLGLLISWGAIILAKRQPSKRFTYGLRSSSILAALANAMFLLLACGAVGWEAIQRFSNTPEVAGMTVSIVAAVGIFINCLSAWLFMGGSKDDINIRSAFLHMAADAGISLGVVIAGVGMIYTHWYWLDPALSLVIVVLILLGTVGLLRDSMHLALNAVPANIDAIAVSAYLHRLAGVTEVHDLHIWGISTTESALTAHLVIPNGYPGDKFMDEVVQTLKTQFAIHHSTLQIEQGTTSHSCTLVAPGSK